MKLLGNDMLGAIEEPPYTDKYIPPYEYTPAFDRPAYREESFYPLKRPPTSPRLPMKPSRYITPPSKGPEYIQGPIGDIVPAQNSPYPEQRIIGDRQIVKIIVSKNLFDALQKRGLPTMAGRRRMLDTNTLRAVENEAYTQTMNDLALIQSGQFNQIQISEAWQKEAIKYKLLDAAEMQNLISRIVGVQSWLSKS